MSSAQKPILVVIGPPGAGKSVLGKQIAKNLRVPFVDTDRRIVSRHGPIPQIFSEHGEAWFRQAERVEVSKALTERAVVALGGGAVLNLETQKELASARVLLVTVSPEAVEARLGSSVRPLLTNGLESWKKIASERAEIYQALATKTVDGSERSIAKLAREVVEWLRHEGEL